MCERASERVRTEKRGKGEDTRKRAEGGGWGGRNKEPGGNNGARATVSRAAVAVCCCPRDIAVSYPLAPFPLTPRRCSFALSWVFFSPPLPCALTLSPPFLLPFFPPRFSPLTTRAARQPLPSKLGRARFGKLKVANEARRDDARCGWPTLIRISHRSRDNFGFPPCPPLISS